MSIFRKNKTINLKELSGEILKCEILGEDGKQKLVTIPFNLMTSKKLEKMEYYSIVAFNRNKELEEEGFLANFNEEASQALYDHIESEECKNNITADEFASLGFKNLVHLLNQLNELGETIGGKKK